MISSNPKENILTKMPEKSSAPTGAPRAHTASRREVFAGIAAMAGAIGTAGHADAAVPADLFTFEVPKAPAGTPPEVERVFERFVSADLASAAIELANAIAWYRKYPELVKAGTMPEALLAAHRAEGYGEPRFLPDDRFMRPDYAARELSKAEQHIEESRQTEAKKAAATAEAERRTADEARRTANKARREQMEREHVISQDYLEAVQFHTDVMRSTLRKYSRNALRRRIAAGWTVEPGRYAVDLSAPFPVIDTAA